MQELDYAKIGLRMKQARKNKRITQDQIAKDLNCTPAFISNVENNRAKLNLKVLVYYAQICGVPMENLLGIDMSSVETSNDAASTGDYSVIHGDLNQKMLETFQCFSTEEKQKIIQTLKIWR